MLSRAVLKALHNHSLTFYYTAIEASPHVTFQQDMFGLLFSKKYRTKVLRERIHILTKTIKTKFVHMQKFTCHFPVSFLFPFLDGSCVFDIHKQNQNRS